jgi:hypothetical protein
MLLVLVLINKRAASLPLLILGINLNQNDLEMCI